MQPIRTGGYLNVLNERHRCNDPQQTIRVSTLMRVHRPRTEEAMLQLLDAHLHTACALCPERARHGGLNAWKLKLWHLAQTDDSAAARAITQADVDAFVYDLYVKSPVRGFEFEDFAVTWLRNHGYYARLATPEEDCRYAVDVVVLHRYSSAVLAGVQVKPNSYRYVRPDVHALNQAKNVLAGYPVFYLYYDNTGRWLESTLIPLLWDLVSYIRYY